MSSIARPRRTEVVSGPALLDRRGVATLLAMLIFGITIISFRPFSPMAAEATGGDIVNQLGFGAVGGVSELDFETYGRDGVRLFGLGSSIFRPGMDAAEVGQRARRVVAAWDAAFTGTVEV